MVAGRTDTSPDTLPVYVAILVSAVTLILGFSLMAFGFDLFWLAFVIGFAGILPPAVVLADYYGETSETNKSPKSESNEAETALAELRNRYARGELSEQEFERRVELLLETESVKDAQGYVERRNDISYQTAQSRSHEELETE